MSHCAASGTILEIRRFGIVLLEGSGNECGASRKSRMATASIRMGFKENVNASLRTRRLIVLRVPQPLIPSGEL
jgi:hypothetical protein